VFVSYSLDMFVAIISEIARHLKEISQNKRVTFFVEQLRGYRFTLGG